MALAIAACGSPPASVPRESTGETSTSELPTVNGAIEPGVATEAPSLTIETDLATEAPAAAAPPSEAAIHLGDLNLIPFAPSWFDGDLAETVFVENEFLRIDSPQESLDPPGRNLVTGAVTDEAYDSFDVSATFNAEGGACRGVDYPCGNVWVTNCIVFDFVDFENMQRFCIEASPLFWTLIAFENGAVVYHSSVQHSDAIHDVGDIYRGGHPSPNEVRLTLRGGLLAGFINGESVFERDGSNVDGKVGAGCVNWSPDPGDELANCEVTLVVTR